MKTLRELGIALIHPGPIVTLCLINTITLTATYCTTMWWPPASSFYALVWMISFFSFSGLTFYNFLASTSVGPGLVPANWKPENDEDCEKVQFCNICHSYKAPRSHHCRKCGKCVLKMDHHCPWINECVGHHNHAHFIAFLISAVFGCSQASLIIGCSIYHALFRSYYIHYRIRDAPLVNLGSFYGLIWCLFILGCAFGVALGVGVLLFYQMKSVLTNRTGIEEWIEEKAYYRRKMDPKLPAYQHPYSFGWKCNWWLVMNLKCEPQGDGIEWTVIDSCDQYTLTLEQIEQKKEKQRRTLEVIAMESYNGAWFPFSKGFCIACHPPCSEESRIPLTQGDKILVSRWKKYWLYGEKLPKNNETEVEVKGWFPRLCVSRHRPTCKNFKPNLVDGCEPESENHSEASDSVSKSIEGIGDAVTATDKPDESKKEK